MSGVVTAILILLGAGIMFLSIMGTQQVLRLLTNSKYARVWQVLLLLMTFFFMGYLAASALVLAGLQDLVLVLTGVVFLIGALFVYLVVRYGYLTIEDLAKTKEIAETAMQARSRFLANMSHELRTPLGAIIGYSEMLQEEATDLGQTRFLPDLKKIHLAGKHLLALINDILDLSKIEAGKMELYLESFSLPPVVREVVAAIRPLADKNANQLEVRCPDDLGEIYADEAKVRQMLYNLLSNACKFTERGNIWLEVAREQAGGADWITVRVKDNGIGMTPEQMGKVFQPFTQADASTTRKYGGSGLGLAITRHYCQMMGGDVTVESEIGRGSAFTIRLPLHVMEAKTEAAPAAESGSRPTVKGANLVLAIDDDPVARDLMRRFLGKEGFRVETASSGDEGIRLARELHPDAITLDVQMPGMDGWSVLAALKTDPDLADIPVIMLTMVDQKNLGYTLGAADYITKPVDRERLVAVLKKYRCAHPPCPILVVEDEPAMRERMRRLLDKEGWAVAEAENGRVALERMRDNRPELILLDLMMPEMDGFEFIQELRKREAWRSIPIVVVTAKDLTPEERLRLSGSVDNILQKGAYDLEALLGEVRRLVAAHTRRDQGPAGSAAEAKS